MNDTYLYGEMFSENILTSYPDLWRQKIITHAAHYHFMAAFTSGFDYLLNYRRLWLMMGA